VPDREKIAGPRSCLRLSTAVHGVTVSCLQRR